MTKKESKNRRLRASRARLLKDIREARSILRSLGVSGTQNRMKRAEADRETRRAPKKEVKNEGNQ